MRILKVLTIVAFVLVTILVFENGQSPRSPKYNTATEVKVEGVVQEVQNYWCPINGDEGSHLTLKTENGVLEVHVAPRRYLQGNGISFNRGDQVSIVGSMVLYEGHDAMIAREVTRGVETFAMRRVDGRPMWVEPLVSHVH